MYALFYGDSHELAIASYAEPDQEMNKKARNTWVKPLSTGSGPRYLQIADLIAKSIQSGQLHAGDQVPSQRWLAAELQVDLTTVTRAYAEARDRGLIASFGGRGSFVLGDAGPTGPHQVDLAMNTPPQPADGSMVARIQAGLQDVLARQSIDVLSRYPGNASSASAVQAARAWLRPALGDVAGQQLLLSEGAQAALFAILLSTTRPGQTVLCEKLTYPGFLQAARQLGLQVIGLDIDDDGVMPDAIEHAHRSSRAQLLYLNPTLHNPTTRTMPENRRQQIASTLARLGMTLIEDDPYRFLLNDVPPPIAALNGGVQTYYLASLSKCLSPALRTAFVLPPRGDDGGPLLEALRGVSMGGSPLLGALVEYWIRSGGARQLVQEIQREARARQTLARSLLPAQSQAHPTGIHVWMPLPTHWNQHSFAHALDGAGVSVACAQSFSLEPVMEDAVRISLGGARDQAELAQALRAVAMLIAQKPRRGVHAIV